MRWSLALAHSTFMEGTAMLATLPRPANRKYPLQERDRSTGSETAGTIKVLDLLSNRYYLGVVRGVSEGWLDVEMPMASRLRVGQRVRFVVCQEGGGAVISRQA